MGRSGQATLAADADRIRREVADYEAMGVDQVQVRFRSRSCEEYVEQIEALRRGGHVNEVRMSTSPVWSTGRSRSCRASARAWGATSRCSSPSTAPTSPSAPARVEQLRGGRRRGRRGPGAEALAVRLDITDADSCQAAVDAAVERFGRIDILVNNAFHDGDFTRFVDADFDSWRHDDGRQPLGHPPAHPARRRTG